MIYGSFLIHTHTQVQQKQYRLKNASHRNEELATGHKYERRFLIKFVKKAVKKLSPEYLTHAIIPGLFWVTGISI